MNLRGVIICFTQHIQALHPFFSPPFFLPRLFRYAFSFHISHQTEKKEQCARREENTCMQLANGTEREKRPKE